MLPLYTDWQMPRHEREKQTIQALCRAWELVHGAAIKWHWNEEEQKAQGFDKPSEQLAYRNDELLAIEHTEVAYFPSQQRKGRTLDAVRTALLSELQMRFPNLLVADWWPYQQSAPFVTRDKTLLDFARTFADRFEKWFIAGTRKSMQAQVPGTGMVIRAWRRLEGKEMIGFSRLDDTSALPDLVVQAVANKAEKLKYLKGKGLRTILLLDTHLAGPSGWYTDYFDAYFFAKARGALDEWLLHADEIYLAADLYEGISIAIPLKAEGDIDQLHKRYWRIQEAACTP